MRGLFVWLTWARRFDQDAAVDAYLAIYERVLQSSTAVKDSFSAPNQRLEA